MGHWCQEGVKARGGADREARQAQPLPSGCAADAVAVIQRPHEPPGERL